ncbi:MAG: baseplate protein [Burkholderiales bacterium RIFCSPLOWO2_02_FULL_57_36]|nr:MAG: baseplate protein [Burkholderiales bacterium RIFCSPLOWO2_02_FULL_57_36]
MAISTKDFATLVRDQVTAIQASSSSLVNFTVGSVLRAMVEANAAVGLWFQGLIVKLLSMMRARTATESDLDSWMADYGVTRLAAVASNGEVTFARFTPTLQALIPFGTAVQTADGSQTFTVVEDENHAAWTAAGYVMAAGISTLIVPADADTAGADGNVSIGQISVMADAISYVDTVTNEASFINGDDAELDPAFRARFVLYIASLARATEAAIGFAVTSVAAGISYTFVENEQYDGTVDYGYFYAVVDDGTGAPTSEFLESVSNAIDAVRGFTIRFGVFAPVVVNATVTFTVTIAAGYDATATKALADAAATDYINALELGEDLAYTRIAQLAYDASPGITNVTAVVLNGGTADLTATPKQVIKSLSVVVS